MQNVILSALAAGAGFMAAKSGGGGGELSANKSLVRKLYREVWNQPDQAKAKVAAAKFISEDHILIDPRCVRRERRGALFTISPHFSLVSRKISPAPSLFALSCVVASQRGSLPSVYT